MLPNHAPLVIAEEFGTVAAFREALTWQNVSAPAGAGRARTCATGSGSPFGWSRASTSSARMSLSRVFRPGGQCPSVQSPQLIANHPRAGPVGFTPGSTIAGRIKRPPMRRRLSGILSSPP